MITIPHNSDVTLGQRRAFIKAALLTSLAACGGDPTQPHEEEQPPSPNEPPPSAEPPPPAEPPPINNAQYSDLWGVNGELWSPQSRLPDFSFAGYRSGNAPIPTPPVTANVMDFGAVGDGEADDTDAILNAIASVSAGVIFIPAGRYKVTRVIQIKKSNIVMRGAGKGLTTLVFPKSLSEIYGAPGYGVASDWTYSGGVIWTGVWTTETKLTDVIAEADRGSSVLTVSNPQSLAVGQTVRLSMTDDASKSLASHVYADEMIGPAPARFVSKIAAISGNQVTLERPLRLNIRTQWSPKLVRVNGLVTGVGIEDFSIEFPDVQYQGHFKEAGFNGIFLYGTWNSWVRNVGIHNCESGVLVEKSAFCTVDNVSFSASETQRFYPWPSRYPTWFYSGHHALQCRNSDDNLISNFAYDASVHFFHYISVEGAIGNVFMEGTAANGLDFDHHGGGTYENLFTEIYIGHASRMWNSSGSATTGARETWWNITARPSTYASPLPSSWPHVNLIGWPTTRASSKDAASDWLEAIPTSLLSPANLYEAQLARRLALPQT